MKKPTIKTENYKGTNTAYNWDIGCVAFGNPLEAITKRHRKLAQDQKRMQKNRSTNNQPITNN